MEPLTEADDHKDCVIRWLSDCFLLRPMSVETCPHGKTSKDVTIVVNVGEFPWEEPDEDL